MQKFSGRSCWILLFDFVNQRTGGSTKYINQRDRDFISAFCRKKTIDVNLLMLLETMFPWEIANMQFIRIKFTKAFFEKAQEYKQVLHLSKRDSVRDTMYSEVLDLIASYECGLAAMIKDQSTQLGRKLNNWELFRFVFSL